MTSEKYVIPTGLSLDVQIGSKPWLTLTGLRPRLNKTCGFIFSNLPRRFQIPATATLLLTTDKAVQKLNFDFRGINKPTNVLSFPQHAAVPRIRQSAPVDPLYLGDIVLGYQYVVAEAKRDHKMMLNHVTHLMIHGILHLFAYNHEAESDAAKMERLETKIMNDMGLPDPHGPETPKTKATVQPKKKPQQRSKPNAARKNSKTNIQG